MYSETWFDSEDDVPNVTGYKPYYLNRTWKRGGGVALFITGELDCELLTDFSFITTHYEFLAVKFRSLVFAVCYRPPSADVSELLLFLDSFFEFLNCHHFNLILGADFNINLFV